MEVKTAVSELKLLLGDRVSTSDADRFHHGNSETWFAAAPPDAVVWPENTAEVAEIIKICAAHLVPVIGFGAGTSLEGHTSAIHGGVSVNFSRMNKVLRVNDQDLTVQVQPGITREELNQELRATGLMFPVDPGANASIGGMASTRASGTTAVRYGTMRDNILAMEVVLADGRVIRTGTGAAKSASGYDLTALFCGAEGTLGLITELTLRLHGQPEAVGAAVCAFPDMQSAVNAVIMTVQCAIPMARIEFLDALAVEAVNKDADMGLPVQPHLLVEFHGSDAAVAEQAERFGEVIADFGASGFDWSAQAEDRSRLWAMRHRAYYACLGLRPGKTAVVTDVCVPVSRLAEAVIAARALIDAAGLVAPILGHVGDGNFHAILLIDPDNGEELTRAKSVSHQMVEHALSMGGTATGEHGIGQGKMDLLRQEHGEAVQVMQAMKQALDPQNIMNPGKIFS
ncbi:FAD-binding oxidoreductase [Halocynthiibacter namhaensis]|uniref:FAD-binding oxidoreductase n=1 Tax=Halocynthiibacter namhaensis TaxID=1290553 RepID=UPI000578E49D|nr:FAD-linked oxidase C-terminal domain-containing protein [Halocynthiibacter namhaensis]